MKEHEEMIIIYCKYIVKNGKVIYPPNKECFRFAVPLRKHIEYLKRKAKQNRDKE